MKKVRCPSNQSGFTLTELLTVIIIIGILSMIAIPKFMSVISKSKITEFKPILKQIYTLEQAFYYENGYYTSDASLMNFDSPNSQYFDYVIEADSSHFTAKAVCKGNIKNAKGELLNGEWVAINDKEERTSSEKIRKIASW